MGPRAQQGRGIRRGPAAGSSAGSRQKRCRSEELTPVRPPRLLPRRHSSSTGGRRLPRRPLPAARITSAAPALGEHTEEIRRSVATPRATPAVKPPQLKPPKVSRGGPLEGVRIVELTKVWAGPYAGKLLAFLGAEVIKVESSSHPDEMRAYGGTDINHAPFFLSINPEVLSVELDVKSATDVGRLRELIARSDIVINNLRPGAMERMGLGYEQLKAIKQDIISVSIKMWGNDGAVGLPDRLRAVFRGVGRGRFT